MKYSKTGNFTEEQIKLAKKIKKDIDALRKSGCTIKAKQNGIFAYKDSDMKHAAPLDSYEFATIGYPDFLHPINFLFCGNVEDSGADDMEYFIKGYITKE